MNRRAIVALLLSAALGCTERSATTSQDSTATTTALLAQERAWTEAFKNRDRAGLTRILAEDFIFTDDAGNVYDKTSYVAAVMDVISVSSYTVDSTTVLIHGDLGVVAGRWTGTMTIAGADASGSFRFTDTFQHRPSGWQVIASQDTRLPAGTQK